MLFFIYCVIIKGVLVINNLDCKHNRIGTPEEACKVYLCLYLWGCYQIWLGIMIYDFLWLNQWVNGLMNS